MYLGTWNIEQRLAIFSPWRRSQRGERRKHRWVFDHLPGVRNGWVLGGKKPLKWRMFGDVAQNPFEKAIQMEESL